VAEFMISLPEAVELYAEISLALAGFAGIASALAGRERRFRSVEKLRLVGVVSLSAAVLGGSLAYMCGSIAGLSESHSESIAAVVSLFLTAPLTIRIFPELWRRSNDPDVTVDSWSLYLVTGLLVTAILLYAFTALGLGAGWQIALAFSLQLMHGIWLFFLLLTRPN